MTGDKGIKTDKLVIGYDRDLIRDICLEVKPGRVMTLIGPNGCGKSTLLKTITGQLKKRGGVVFVDGSDREGMNRLELARSVSMVTTERVNPELMSCREVVAMGRYPYTGRLGILSEKDRAVTEEAMASTGTLDIAERLFTNISDGQRQRVMLARAVCQEPEILVLDEPTSYLDIRYRVDILTQIKSLAREKGIAVIMSLHELETAMRISDTVVAMNGEGVQRLGTPEEVFEEGFIRRLYGIEGKDISLVGDAPWFKTSIHEKLPVPSGKAGGKTKVIMVQGTMSGVGKSMIAAALCRIFTQDGYRVAPFKSQNMALNSCVTREGLEMGRAQVMQAECCGIEPRVCMNPILLKPTGENGSQVIINGIPRGDMNAREYFSRKKELVPVIKKAYEELCETVDIVVVEGAGSPAELNLKEDDIVNMGLARILDAPVILAGDIDRGGVFAQLIGTVELLEEEERRRIGGLIVNKLRGDRSLFDRGVRILEEKTGIKVLGTLPYIKLDLDDEDSQSGRFEVHERKELDLAVIHLPHISNFTDFSVFDQLEEVSVNYTESVKDLEGSDMIILPGTKNTIADLRWLKEKGLAEEIIRLAGMGKPVFGICGGYQMLGRSVSDPEKVEDGGSEEGLGLLEAETVLTGEKVRSLYEGRVENSGGLFKCLEGRRVRGYEIHMGQTEISPGVKPFTSGGSGCHSENVYGTYVHGFFDLKEIAEGVLEAVAALSGRSLDLSGLIDQDAYKESRYDLLADTVRKYLDMDSIYRIMGIER
ncbi:MAG: cobyric acid synthase [Lachnospiraceae bacterium]|nr:cobyric acid synthase [Lachnospiraceae bacterium]